MMSAAAGFLLGFAGSAHCLGMCGPLALLARRNSISHHAGRLLVYLILGVAAGLMGGGLVYTGGSRHVLSLTAGVTLLLAAVVTSGRFARVGAIDRLNRQLSSVLIALRQTLARYGLRGAFVFGVFNGLLPCGLLYTALAGAAGLGDVAAAMLFMASFAAGTLPVFIGVSLSSGIVSARLPQSFRRAAPLATALIGLLLIARGLQVTPLAHAAAHLHHP